MVYCKAPALAGGAVTWFFNFIFRIVYRRWLWDKSNGTYSRVIRVKSWRTALIERVTKRGTPGQRWTISPCFWWFT